MQPDFVPGVATDYQNFVFDSDEIGPSATPDDLYTSSGSAHLDLTQGGGMSTGSGYDLSGLAKAVPEVATTVIKTVGNLARPPVPQIPTPPSVPNLPASLPPLGPPPAPPPPAAPVPVAGAGTVAPSGRLSTGAKVAIGLGVAGLAVGGGLLLMSAAGKRRRPS